MNKIKSAIQAMFSVAVAATIVSAKAEYKFSVITNSATGAKVTSYLYPDGSDVATMSKVTNAVVLVKEYVKQQVDTDSPLVARSFTTTGTNPGDATGTGIYFRTRYFGMENGDRLKSFIVRTRSASQTVYPSLRIRLRRYADNAILAYSDAQEFPATGNVDVTFTFPVSISIPNKDNYYYIEFVTEESSSATAQSAGLRCYSYASANVDLYFQYSTIVPVMTAQFYSFASNLATLDSPAFTGTPTAPTPTAGDNSTNIATTAFVKSETLGNSGDQTLNGSLTQIATGPNGIQKEIFFSNIASDGMQWAIVFNGSSPDMQLLLPTTDGTLALLSDIYDAVTNIAPAWVSGTSYAANALVTYNGVVYQNTSGATIQNATTPDTSRSGWTAKKVSELFLPLTGGTMTGNLAISNASIAFLLNGAIKATVMPSIFGSGLYISNENSTVNVLLPLNSSGTIALLQNLAADYSASAKYTLNQLCVYNNKLYRCTTAITTAEAWTAAHWTEATVEDVLAAIRSALNDKAPLVSPAFTGTPTAPTPSSGDNSTNIATTAFVKSETLGNSGYQILEGTLGIATNKNAQGEVRYNNITDITPYGMRITDHWTRILLGGSGREPFTTTYGYKQIAVKAGFEEEKIIAIPAESGTMALLSDIYDAVTNIAPAWVSGTSYAANKCVSYQGVVYQNTSHTTISSATTPNTPNSGWTAKRVDELFLPKSGDSSADVDVQYLYASAKVYSNGGYYFGGAETACMDIDGIYVGENSYDWAQRSGTFALLQNLAPNFSASATYAENELCIYNGKLYRCTTDITYPENWNASHWAVATVQDVLSRIAYNTRLMECKLPDDCFPITYSSRGTNYTIISNGELFFSDFGSDIERGMYNIYTGDNICGFYQDTGKFAWSGDNSLKFNNISPTPQTWPVLTNETAVVVRNIVVAQDSDVLKKSGDQAMTGTLKINSWDQIQLASGQTLTEYIGQVCSNIVNSVSQ